MSWLDIPTLAIFAIYLFTTAKPRGFVTADCLFAYFQLIMVTGTFPELEPNLRADTVYGYVLAYAFIAYLLCSMFIHAISGRGRRVRLDRTVLIYRPSRGVWLLLAVSMLVVIAYYVAVGYSAFLVGLTSEISGGSADVATLRLNSYSGTHYFAPGYVAQFKNALLPALVVVILTYFTTTRYRHRIFSTFLILFTLFAVLGTGQRGAFILFVVTLASYLYLLERRRFGRRAFALVLATIAIASVSTFALGRSSSQVSSQHSIAGKAGVLLAELWDRITDSNQSSGIIGFRYTYALPNQHGTQWIQSLLDLLPGFQEPPGTNLDSLIFASIYGDPRGTAPPSLWGSIYYNFGPLGVAVAPVIFAVLLHALSDRALAKANYNTLELIGIAGTFATLGSWVADGPNYLANSGIVVYIVVWLVGARHRIDPAELAVESAEDRCVKSPWTRAGGLSSNPRMHTTAKARPS